MKIIRSKLFLCLICFILAISMINVCLAAGYGVYFPAPDITKPTTYDPSQSYYKSLEAERRRKELQRLELQNQMLQQEMRERELQRHNRIIEERRQQRLLEERRQAETKKQTEQGKDIYAELIKLDELKQKGIITEEEFEIQKKKILSYVQMIIIEINGSIWLLHEKKEYL